MDILEEIHGLKLENETLKIHAIEREKMIKRLTATSNNGDEYQIWQFVKTRSSTASNQEQIPLIKGNDRRSNEAENGDQEETYPNNNILTRRKKKQ